MHLFIIRKVWTRELVSRLRVEGDTYEEILDT